MLQLELPHINVLSKIDLLEKYGPLDFNLEFYKNATNLFHLQLALDKDNKQSSKFHNLTEVLCNLVEDFSLVSFTTLSITKKESLANLVKIVDRANGFIYTTQSYSDLLNYVHLNDDDFSEYR